MSLTPTAHSDVRDTTRPPVRGVATRAAIGEALVQAGALSPWLGGSVDPAPSGAPHLAGLAEDHDLLVGLVAGCADRLETDRRDVAAGLLFHDIAWRVVAPPITTAVAVGVAPRLAADEVTVVLDDRGASTAVHFTAPTGHRSASTAAPDLDLLRLVRDDVVTALGPLVTALRPLARRGEPSMWGEVADTVATALQTAGGLTGRVEACRVAADRLLDGTRPIRGGANWVEVDHAGICCTWRVRNSCCKAFELTQYDYCAGCPMLCDADQRARFEALNEAQVAATSA